MSIMDNEGHNPNGLGNRPRHTEVLCACTDSCAKDAEIERLRAALVNIGILNASGGNFDPEIDKVIRDCAGHQQQSKTSKEA